MLLVLISAAAALTLESEVTRLAPRIIDYQVEITAGAADVTVTQHFSSAPAEANWRFPLPPEAMADRIAVACGSLEVTGEIEPREVAEIGSTGGIRMPLACVGEPVTVTLHYVAPLHAAGAQTILVLPLTDGPRADVEVRLDALPDRTVWSDSHDITVRGDVVTAHAQVAGEDLVLSWSTAAAPRLSVVSHRALDGDVFLGLTVDPGPLSADGPVLPRELIIAVDTSYAMRRAVLAEATVAAALDGLRPEDTFNLVRFSMRAEALHEVSQPIGPESVGAASAFLADRTGAGSWLEVGLAEALALPADAARLRVVVLISDSAQADEARIRVLLDDALGDARLFPVRLDGPDPDLLEGLALIGRGAVIRSMPGGSDAEFAEQIQARIAAPAATDIEIAWGAGTRGVFPRRLPDLWYGTPLQVVGQVIEVPQQITVTGQAADGRLSITGSTGGAAGADHAALSTLWGAARLTALAHSGPRQRDPLIFETRGLGLHHQLSTPYTALLLGEQVVSGGWSAPIRVPEVSGGPGEGSLKLQGLPTVLGSIAAEDVQRAMRGWIPRLRECVARSEVRGRLTLSITIGPTGAVSDVTLSSASLAHVELESCMAAAVRPRMFPPIPGGGSVILRYPLLLGM